MCLFCALLLGSLQENVVFANNPNGTGPWWDGDKQQYSGWTDTSLSATSYTKAKAAHLNEIRDALRDAQNQCGATSLEPPTTEPGGRFYASNLNEYRAAIRNFYLSPGTHGPQSPIASNSVWDSDVSSGQKIYAAHIQDMRDAIDRIGLVCRAACGNGIQETGETCDLGPGSIGACPKPCSLTCQSNTCPPCGDGSIDVGETCDNGASNGSCPAACSAACTPNTCSFCGDGTCDSGEDGWCNDCGGGPCTEPGPCTAAEPACGETTWGTDNCGACSKTGPACCTFQDCLFSGPLACETTYEALDNCGNPCSVTGPPCTSCGDGQCNNGESCTTCEADCGACCTPGCTPKPVCINDCNTVCDTCQDGCGTTWVACCQVCA